MANTLPFFNWSLKKARESEPDNFTRARINIAVTMLLFALAKAVLVIILAAANEQWRQVARAAISFLVFSAFMKILLYQPSRLQLLAHIMVLSTIGIVYSSIFVYSHSVNLLTAQFIFTIILASFYIIGNTAGIIYSTVSTLPVIVIYALKGNAIYLTEATQELASPGFEIMVALNFATMIIAHYLFLKAFNNNIEEKEALNQQLQLSVTEANKLAEARANFLSTMSHELRTPLNSVIGISELLIKENPAERQKENLNILHFSAMDLLNLINNVLDFNKLDAEKVTLEKVNFGLAAFMQNICSVLNVKARDKGLSLVLELDEGLKNMHVLSDPVRLSQVMYNLIGNAIKFTEKGTVGVKLSLANKSENYADVLFSVSDTGIGISPDKHDEIFEMFTQAESHTVRKHGGTGLGLPIVRQTLQLFDSSIQLESKPGTGSTFFFTISFELGAEVRQAATESSGQNFSDLKILIAEDNYVNKVILEKQLAVLNVKPEIVDDGKKAFEAVSAAKYDAVFLDLHMPGLTGYETIRKIRTLPDEDRAKTYVIAFTASVAEGEKIVDSGFDDFLFKPVKLDELRAKLEKISQRGKAEIS